MKNYLDINVIHKYSRSYGRNLEYCEELYSEGKGYIALLILFQTIENMCKSIIENYDLRFIDVVTELRSKGLIDKQVEKFLSSGKHSIRRIRNLFSHTDLSTISFFEEGIYYSLDEEESCLVLYEKLFIPSIDIMIILIKNKITN